MNTDLPLGFAMALAQNEAAMRGFENLNEKEKQAILYQAHNVHSKMEMRRLVSGLSVNGQRSEHE